MPLDAAIASALGVSSSECTVSPHGGSGFSSTSKIETSDGRTYFLKVGRGDAAASMFEGEHQSLNAIHRAEASLCPASLGFGALQDQPSSYFLVTDFLDLSSGRRGSGNKSDGGSGLSLAQKLAKLHTTPAPTPEGRSKPAFGFPVTTCCGDTPQENDFADSWAGFYAERRLRAIYRGIQKNQGGDKELGRLIETAATKVVPRLLGEGHLGGAKGIVPVVVHGDLWSGNASRGRLGGKTGPEEAVVFDPSACYAHSEYELGIMKMFGGFGGMLAEYHELVPKTEPVEEYEDRVALYEVYHHLNHYSIFGGGYRGGAVSILERLAKKYGG